MKLNPNAAAWHPSTTTLPVVLFSKKYTLKLPEDIWMGIFLDHGLDYFDMKRMARVAKGFQELLKKVTKTWAPSFATSRA
ncbi:hypothetical protein T439DRAFT_359786 [Meredithblackwellia eburnea MCA 4105]